jgi:hypothetical protein
MTVPGIDTLSEPSAACSRRVAGFPNASAPRLDPELARMREWPLRSYLELRALPTSVGYARRHARSVLRRWGMGHLPGESVPDTFLLGASVTDTVELLVSEIVTNAVRASAGIAPEQHESGQALRTPWIRFWLTSDGRSVLIGVWDADHRHPTWQNPGPDAEAGRGLLLIEALSARWGSAVLAGQGGKIVWATCTK